MDCSAAVVFLSEANDPAPLVDAFASARFRTAIDARTASQRGGGVCADRISAPVAAALCDALRAHGIAAATIAASDLVLPSALRVRELTGDAVGMNFADALGRPMRVPWAALRALAVAQVAVMQTKYTVARDDAQRGSLARGVTRSPLSHFSDTIKTTGTTSTLFGQDLVCEVLHEGGRLRFTSEGAVIKHRGLHTQDEAYRTLLRTLIETLPDSVPRSAAARALAADARAQLPKFASPRDLERHLAWVAWRAAFVG